MWRERLKYGFALTDWNAAKEEARAILIERAGRKNTIPYSELVQHISSCSFEPHGYQLPHLLAEISVSEDELGRGLLSAVVVLKERNIPGDGFFRMAKERGRDTADKDACWSIELEKVFAAHSD